MKKIFLYILLVLLGIGFAAGLFKFSDRLPIAVKSESETKTKKVETGVIPKIYWETLNLFNYKTGEGPQELTMLNGKLVEIPGFIVPLTDSYSDFDEFLLVPNAQACVHIPPPPPNLIVAVKLRKPMSMEDIFYPSWVKGIFTIETSTSEFGSASYKLDAMEVRKYEF
ncbi:MAG TPA: DUF3299 domain-containing protein [Oligoflexia bacterium]|nr:DUF3299 domain-containing protein [Oligoflexia bacterium]HMR24661.1 DUF3299 domain-containing protein [Oligoflexia bacterium]